MRLVVCMALEPVVVVEGWAVVAAKHAAEVETKLHFALLEPTCAIVSPVPHVWRLPRQWSPEPKRIGRQNVVLSGFSSCPRKRLSRASKNGLRLLCIPCHSGRR